VAAPLWKRRQSINPGVFFATCALLIGPEVKLTIEQSLPSNLSMGS
jgi:hypothetical protein